MRIDKNANIEVGATEDANEMAAPQQDEKERLKEAASGMVIERDDGTKFTPFYVAP